ncbi:MAG: secretin N-terminal domain-containing protein [Candidatus Omnitrophota bacterium]
MYKKIIYRFMFVSMCVFIGSSFFFAAEAADVSMSEGERISLDLKGMDLIELFKLLSIKTNKNIVPTKNVSGRVTLYLNNVTFDDVFDIILVSNALAKDKRGEIINVMTAAEYETIYGERYDEKRRVEIFKLNYAKPANVFNALSQIKSNIGKIVTDEATGTIIVMDTPDKLELIKHSIEVLDRPLGTELFELKYATANELETQISKIATPGTANIMTDKRTNKLMVTDLPDKVGQIKRLVRNFDESTKQVLIEARIIQITLNKNYQMGVDWEYVFNNARKFDGQFPVNKTTGFGQFTLGVVGENDFAGVLDLLEHLGKTNILSRPRIMVLNNQEAKILIGTKEAYVTSTLSQGQSTTVTSESIEYIDVGLKLNVTPTINKDGFVLMQIKPEVSTVAREITTALGSVIPIVETSEAETAVKVKDGVTVIIAGLMKDERRINEGGMPVISKIPLVGNLFKSQEEESNKTELIVFLTPHIVEGDENLVEAPSSTVKIELPGIRLPHVDARNVKEQDKTEDDVTDLKTTINKPAPVLKKDLKKEQPLENKESSQGVKN